VVPHPHPEVGLLERKVRRKAEQYFEINPKQTIFKTVNIFLFETFFNITQTRRENPV
jgi:hypothetical protein